MTRHDVNRSDPLIEEIRRQFGSPGMTRYLSKIPTLSVEPGLPERLRDLLGDLQRAEARRRGRGAGKAG